MAPRPRDPHSGTVLGIAPHSKEYENNYRRLRKMAHEQGLVLEKSRTRDRMAAEFGTFQIADGASDTVIATAYLPGYGMTLDEVERFLTSFADDTSSP